MRILFLLAVAAQDYAKLSPFEATRWKEDRPEVRVAGSWYALEALNGHAADRIVRFCKDTYGRRWQKRFDEDLVEVLSRMGHPPGKTVTLRVKALDSREVRTLKNVAMTEANRRAIWRARNERRRAPPSRADGLADLEQLRVLLETRYSYFKRKKVDVPAAFDAIRSRLADPLDRNAFALEVQKLIALFGDGHSGIEGSLGSLAPGGTAPFLVGEVDGRWVAFKGDRTGYLDADHPYIEALDGIPVQKWLDAAAKIVPAGSPQFVRRLSARHLRYLAYLRRELGREAGATVKVELASEDGKRTLELPLAPRRPLFGAWPRSSSTVLDGNVGYLRIPRMDNEPEFLKGLTDAMERFRRTRGLIIDVRGNGGGSREPLRTLFPYFMRAEDPPHVANVAALRLEEGQDSGAPEGYLQNRFSYPATSKAWPARTREVLKTFESRFVPEWRLPEGEFSAWHYFVLDRPKGTPFAYRGPVVVLMDGDCFSATDIFLGAFKGWRNVTLFGTASGGGSGRTRGYVLPRTRLRLRLSSMASFRPNGKLYDGRGIEPDVVVNPDAGYWIGRSDPALKEALRRLR